MSDASELLEEVISVSKPTTRREARDLYLKQARSKAMAVIDCRATGDHEGVISGYMGTCRMLEMAMMCVENQANRVKLAELLKIYSDALRDESGCSYHYASERMMVKEDCETAKTKTKEPGEGGE